MQLFKMRKKVHVCISHKCSTLLGSLYLTLTSSIIICTKEVMLAFRARLNTVLCQFSANCSIKQGIFACIIKYPGVD